MTRVRSWREPPGSLLTVAAGAAGAGAGAGAGARAGGDELAEEDAVAVACRRLCVRQARRKQSCVVSCERSERGVLRERMQASK